MYCGTSQNDSGARCFVFRWLSCFADKILSLLVGISKWAARCSHLKQDSLFRCGRSSQSFWHATSVTGYMRFTRLGRRYSPFSSPPQEISITQKNLKSLILARHVVRVGEKRTAYRVLVGKCERKTPLEWPRRRWKDIIRINPKRNCF